MATFFAEVEEQARMLPPEERARLAELLLESLDEGVLTEIEELWRREIEDRVTAYDRGDVQTHSAEDIFAEATRIGR